MLIKHLLTKSALIAAGGALALGAFAGSAHASSANISKWTSDGTSCKSWFKMCVFYSPGASGGTWGTKEDLQSDFGRFTFTGGSGNGKTVGNDGASADNNTNCNIAIWNGFDWSGDSDWLSPHRGGNFGPALRNKNASIAIDDSTNCPGQGLG